MVAAVERLIDTGEDNLSPEESALLETMAILVQAYDDRHHPLHSVAPNEMLAYLMETSGRTRSISKEQAKKLAPCRAELLSARTTVHISNDTGA